MPRSFTGPSTWEGLCMDGSSQSPIDIPTNDAEVNTALGTFTRDLFDALPTGMTLANTGHSSNYYKLIIQLLIDGYAIKIIMREIENLLVVAFSSSCDGKRQWRYHYLDKTLYDDYLCLVASNQSCKSGRDFRVGFGPGSGRPAVKVDKDFVLSSGRRRAFCLRCTKM